ncbi:DNA glycosylase AlkZ-like family protein [Frankia sp. Cr1]|uniref:DNA glycosylase AlkZ-like family protein n=1 Tax=Frankia sp. Cr1 TaxID=3073931 RepID=UPI002AD46C4A|nr:crosslink repair DNA glycosylase YcaQ family protein [Frankia sp. Cr1]
MVVAAPRTVGAVTLTGDQAGHVWNWILARQGLHPEQRLSSVAEIADAGLGIHAARLPSPFATVLARAASPNIAMTLLTPLEGMTTLRCMRKTLHLLPLDLAAIAHAATARYRLRDAARMAVNAGVSRPALARATQQLTELLAEGALPVRQIEAALTDRSTPVSTVRVALKAAWEQGALTYLNQSGCWNAERRAFALTADIHPGLDVARDPGGATRELVRAYFLRYGPATLRDATWWSALSRSAVAAALGAAEVAWLEVTTPWCAAPAYMAAAQYEQFLAADAATFATGLNLLAHEDVALKAYFETRGRYLAGLPSDRAFNQIGEALPTLLVDGHVQGTWRWDPAGRAVRPMLARDRASRLLLRRVSSAAETLTDALRAGSRGRRPRPVFPRPDQLALIY